MENVKKTLEEVKAGVQQKSASRKDETTVMRAMLNDPEYSVDVYDKKGNVTSYKPGEEFRKLVSNVVASTTKIPSKEAAELVSGYNFTNSDASTVIDFSKEFVNTYLQTGRKLSFGGRKDSDISIIGKMIAEREAGVPAREGVPRGTTIIPAHGGIKAYTPCPAWLKK